MNSSKRGKEMLVYEILLVAPQKSSFWYIDFILSVNKIPLVTWFDIWQEKAVLFAFPQHVGVTVTVQTGTAQYVLIQPISKKEAR